MNSKEPRYGYYPWWPQDGDEWLDPADIEIARRSIPSMRIFRREETLPPYITLFYGDLRIRAMRTLWNEVEWEGYNLGDWVEVLSRGQLNTPRTGTIREMLWDDRHRGIRYQIFENDQPIPKLYSKDDLRPIDPTSRRIEPSPYK